MAGGFISENKNKGMINVFGAICIGILMATVICLIGYGIIRLIFYIISVTIDRYLENRKIRKRNNHRLKCGLKKI